MAENDYGGSFQEGQQGQFFSGGNSIDYAGYTAGQDAKASADALRARNSGVGGGRVPGLPTRSRKFGPLPAVLLGGLGGTFIGGPVLGLAAALVLFVVWMTRNRG